MSRENLTEQDKKAWIGDRQVAGQGTPVAEVTSVVDTSVDDDESVEDASAADESDDDSSDE